jgi:hypothetical protein
MLGSRVRGSPCIDAYGAWTSIHLVYVRAPSKGIATHRLLRGNDDTGEIGIDNVLGGNSCG